MSRPLLGEIIGITDEFKITVQSMQSQWKQSTCFSNAIAAGLSINHSLDTALVNLLLDKYCY